MRAMVRTCRSVRSDVLVGLAVAALAAAGFLASSTQVRAATSGVAGVSLVSVGNYDASSDGDSSAARISADGKYVVYESSAANLVSGSGAYSGVSQIYICERANPRTTVRLVSHVASGAAANGPSHTPAISEDGRYVVFSSIASNLTSPSATTPGTYRWDRTTDAIERVDVLSGQAGSWGSVGHGDDSWEYPSVSANGDFVAFASGDAGLAGGSNGGVLQVFRRDMATGDVVEVSVDSTGALGAKGSRYPSISDDGTRVSFTSYAALVATDTNPSPDIYLRDLSVPATTLLSAPAAGGGTVGAASRSAISGDGKVVAFTCSANLTADSSGAYYKVFARVIASGAPELVSATRAGTAPDAKSYNPSISRNGAIVSYQSDAGDVATTTTSPTYYAVFVRDRTAGKTTAVGPQVASVSPYPSSAGGSSTSVSADGRFVAFDSQPDTSAPLTSDAPSGHRDVYVYDRFPQVKATLSTPKLSTSRPRRNRYFYVTGTVTRHTGKAKVQLRFYKRSSQSVYKTYTTYTASGSSKYKVRVKLSYAGKMYVRAYHPEDTAHVLSWSSIREFTTRR
jgi:Tol biopolymer transport system component